MKLLYNVSRYIDHILTRNQPDSTSGGNLLLEREV